MTPRLNADVGVTVPLVSETFLSEYPAAYVCAIRRSAERTFYLITSGCDLCGAVLSAFIALERGATDE
jgi:hypothetical protein